MVIRNIGKYAGVPMIEVQKMMKAEFGDIYRIPGLFGANEMITTFNANDIEFVHRTEGVWPFRRGMETMLLYRQKYRSDVYDVGGLIVE